EVEQLALTYHPDWPQLKDLLGTVVFTKKNMQIDLRQGLSEAVKVQRVAIGIPDLQVGEELTVKGNVACDFGKCLDFLQHSPLKERVQPLLAATTPQGQTDVALNLNLPLVANKEPKVDVTATLHQAKLAVKALDLSVSQINGAIKYTAAGIHSEPIKAVALGQAIDIVLARDRQQTVVNVAGRAEISALQKQFKLPWWQIAEGDMGYRLKLALPDKAEEPLQLDVQSDLAGVTLDLPGDLGKTKAQQRSLLLSFDLNQKLFLPINVTYDQKLKAALKFNIAKQSVDAGHILLGNGTAKLPKESGLEIEINHDKLDLQDWLGLAATQNSGSLGDSNIRKITMRSEHALWKTADLGGFQLELKPEQQNWLAQLSSSFASGKIHIPAQSKIGEKIVLTLQQLDLSVLKQLKSQSHIQGAAVSPADMPLFTLSSAKTLWNKHDLGMMVIETERVADGVVFKHIDLFGHDQKLTATGDWKSKGNGSETHVQGRLDMPEAGDMLTNLGITKDIAAASGYADFLCHWPGAPQQFSLPDLKGNLTLNLKRGRILSIEPGFGRILGVLALAQWINRLQLDFSDIYQEGLTFNSIKGRFDLSNGIAVTHNLIVDAIPAKI
ncbi:MAG: DUF3971 domain-containing protein, partial [Methylococcales bacterium]